jgi:hypothetical protein
LTNWRFWKKKKEPEEPEQQIKITIEHPKQQEEKEYHYTTFIPYRYERKAPYIRGVDTIKFAVNYDVKNLYLFSVTLTSNNYYNAYAKMEYDVKAQKVTTHLDDGYINKDNGYVSHRISDGLLILEWHIGTGVTLGSYNVEMKTVSVNESKTMEGDSLEIHENTKSFADYEKSELVNSRPRNV